MAQGQQWRGASDKIVSRHEAEAPQVAYSDIPLILSHDRDAPFSAEGHGSDGQASPVKEHDVTAAGENDLRRSKWSWRKTIVAVIACIIGLGVGIGVGVAIGKHTADRPKDTVVYRTTTVHTKPSSTTAAVTSGTTGIASFDCNHTVSSDTYTTPSGITFREQCYTNYPVWVWNSTTNSPSTTTQIADVNIVTVYSFQSCMNQCVEWNQKPSTSHDRMCEAVTYYANLTATIVAGASGNCWLKDARGTPDGGDTSINYSLMGSAYILDP